MFKVMYFIKSLISRNTYPMCIFDKKGNSKVCIVDTYPSLEFNINPDTGWPANDITLFERAQSDAEKELVLSRLKEIQSTQGFNSETSVSDIISSIKPRLVQSPSELQSYVEFVSRELSRDALLSINDEEEKSVGVVSPGVEPSVEVSE